MRLLAILLLTALGCDAATYRFDFTPGYAYVVKVKSGRPQSIHVARVIKEKLKRIPQTTSLDSEGHFTITCTLESQNPEGPVLTGFVSLSGEVGFGADGVPEVTERGSEKPLKPVPAPNRVSLHL